jgi:hypothetical protein
MKVRELMSPRVVTATPAMRVKHAARAGWPASSPNATCSRSRTRPILARRCCPSRLLASFPGPWRR